MRRWTGRVVFFGVLFACLWDFGVYYAGGIEATISSQISGWLSLSWLAGNPLPVMGFEFVVVWLFVHWCGNIMQIKEMK